ncbi:MAG: hypothetical protein ACREXS_17450 [Gammaproteobacteria bacterium]
MAHIEWSQEEEMRFIGNRQDVNLIFDGHVSEVAFGPHVTAHTLEQLVARIASHCSANNIQNNETITITARFPSTQWRGVKSMDVSDDKNRAFVCVKAWGWRSRSARNVDLSKYEDSSYYLVDGVRSDLNVGPHFMMFYHGDDKAHVERALEFACALCDRAYSGVTLYVFSRKPERLLRMLGYGPQDGCSIERYRVSASRTSSDPQDSPVWGLLYAGSNLGEAKCIFEQTTPEYDEVLRNTTSIPTASTCFI